MDEIITDLREQLKKARKGKKRWKRKAIEQRFELFRVNPNGRLTKWSETHQRYYLDRSATIQDAICLLGKYEDVIYDWKCDEARKNKLGYYYGGSDKDTEQDE